MNWVLINHIFINLMIYASIYALIGVFRRWKEYNDSDRLRAICCCGLLLLEWLILIAYEL